MRHILAVTTATLALVTTMPAMAQSPAPGAQGTEEVSLSEIIVTARKREETLRDIPSTITAQTADQLEAKGPVTGVGDLLQLVPGVRFNGVQSENLAEVSVRGSGTQRATSADSGVGLFVNGAYVGSSTLGGRNFKRIDYFDIARVEVLEGPQGGLYGRNSEFGTINIVLAQPQFRDTGRVQATYNATQKQLQLEGIVNQAVSDTVAVRLGAQVTGQGGGIYYNPNQDEYYDHTDGYIVRGQMRYSSGAVDAKLLVDAMDMNLPTFVNQWVLPPGMLAALPQGYTGPRYDVPSDVKNGVHQNVVRAMLIADVDLDDLTLTWTTMGSRSESAQSFPAAVDLATQANFQRLGQIGLYPLGQTSTYARNKTLYQDIHVSGGDDFMWMAGVEGMMQNDYYTRDAVTNPCPLTATSSICGGTPTTPLCYKLLPTSLNCPTVFPLAFGARQVTPSKYRSAAAYGSLKHDIGRLSLSGDLRWSYDYKEATQRNYQLYTSNLSGTPSSFDFSQDSISYSATASYNFGEDLPMLLYVKTGSGYRAGGVNNGTYIAAAPNPLRTSYDNETTTSYEVGFKGSFTRDLFLRLSGYISNTDDAITSILDGCTVTNACGRAGTYFNLNGGKVRVKGVEAAFDAKVPLGAGVLALGLTGARQDAKFVSVAAGVSGLPVIGSPVAQTPDWTWSVNANIRQPIGENLTGFFNVAYNGARGGGQDTVTLATPYIPLEDIDNVDLRAGVEFERMTFAAFVKNATDNVIPVLKLQSGSIPLTNRYNNPRTYGFSASYRW
ncbi:TonB-dependent receptor [Niveispirillum fermenti]|uniref:TonB-dependent receptor n=1 Tax=Niveispirillum fermenti TaxID=1233113 RepID=UPI003A86A262